MNTPRMLMAAVAATLISTASFATPPSADQVSVPQGQTMSRHQARMQQLFQSPDQFMMFRMEMKEATRGMSRDQKRSWRRAELQKVKAMNAKERDSWLHGLQAKWDALPNARKERMEARLENKQYRHHGQGGAQYDGQSGQSGGQYDNQYGAPNGGQNGGRHRNQGAAPNAGQAPYDQSDDDASAPPQQLQH
ncbi:MAG: hypothetical protein JOZ72_11060 [Alphaproteobacteria bacterium]|nr:hypothetical protein [Alphaproteobacteria bacterium]